MIRVVIHERRFTLSLGVGTRELNTSMVPQELAGQGSFFGLYLNRWSSSVVAAGWTVNACAPALAEHRLAVLVDIEARTMQCFAGLDKFGPLVSGLPKDDLWPVIVVGEIEDSVSLSVGSTEVEVESPQVEAREGAGASGVQSVAWA